MKLQHELMIFLVILVFAVLALLIAGNSLTGRLVYESEELNSAKTFGNYVNEFFDVKTIFFSQRIKSNACGLVAEEFLFDFFKESPGKLRGFESTGSSRILSYAFEGSSGKEFYGNIDLMKGNQFIGGDNSDFVQLKFNIKRLVFTIKDNHAISFNLTFNGVLENNKVRIDSGSLQTNAVDCSFEV